MGALEETWDECCLVKLTDLDPKFLTIISEKSWQQTDSIVGADGISFLCPKCFVENEGPKGTHIVICWSPEVSQTIGPVPGRWRMEGSGFRDLTLVARSSSILLLSGCKAHFFIRNGEIV